MKDGMKLLTFLAVAAVFAAGLLAAPASAKTIETVLGDEVELGGSATGYSSMYLFLTGPNLAPGGVCLDNIASAVTTGVPSSFTQADVSGNRWEYKWDTSDTGSTLDAGNYLVVVSGHPTGRSDMISGEYSMITVILRSPEISSAGAIPTETPQVTDEPTVSPSESPSAASVTPSPSETEETATVPPTESPVPASLASVSLLCAAAFWLRR